MEICMNKKRVTAVILSAMMCMQIFTGCGAKNNAAAVEGGAGQTATESAQGEAGTATEKNAQAAEENVQGTADQDGTEESMTGNDAAEQADSTEVSVPEDGEYTVEVTLEGGSGKATVDSQAKVTVKDGVAYATITWSSTHYDYMIVNGEKYLNENEGGNSTFTFPIDGIPCEMDVIGDTTAMSTPHEIDYTLTFQFPETAGFKDLDCNGRMELSYADQFEVEQYGAYKLITIVDNGRFLLVPKGVKVPADVPADVTVLQQPLENVYLVSSAVMDLVCQIGAVSDLKYTGVKEKDWYVKEAADAMAAGNLIYAGKYSAPDYELLLSGGCTFAIENTMITHNPEVKEKLEELGIKVMIERSSYEKHPLGRLEWIKLFGVLFGREQQAKAFFDAQAAHIEPILEKEKTGLSVAFFAVASDGTITVRKPNDYVSSMIELAGGTYSLNGYVPEEENALSTLKMQMEDFYAAEKDADILIYNGTIEGELTSIAELVQKNSLFADFKAVKSGQVYTTGNNFYQQTSGTCDFIEDLNKVLNGETDAEYRFLKKIN